MRLNINLSKAIDQSSARSISVDVNPKMTIEDVCVLISVQNTAIDFDHMTL